MSLLEFYFQVTLFDYVNENRQSTITINKPESKRLSTYRFVWANLFIAGVFSSLELFHLRHNPVFLFAMNTKRTKVFTSSLTFPKTSGPGYFFLED